MEKIFSTRIDEAVYRKIGDLSIKMHTSKKNIIETAIKNLGQLIEQDTETTVFDRTFGVWKRDETPAETVSHVRRMFRESMNRNRK